MSANKNSIKTDWTDADEAPDLSSLTWQNHIESKAKRGVGRPPALFVKVSQTLRLDQDVISAFKASGVGWQTRMNDALRKAAGLS